MAREPLATYLAGIRPFSSVHATMAFEMTAIDEPLAALLARVRPLAGVDKAMSGDVTFARKPFCANVTHKGAFVVAANAVATTSATSIHCCRNIRRRQGLRSEVDSEGGGFLLINKGRLDGLEGVLVWCWAADPNKHCRCHRGDGRRDCL